MGRPDPERREQSDGKRGRRASASGRVARRSDPRSATGGAVGPACGDALKGRNFEFPWRGRAGEEVVVALWEQGKTSQPGRPARRRRGIIGGRVGRPRPRVRGPSRLAPAARLAARRALLRSYPPPSRIPPRTRERSHPARRSTCLFCWSGRGERTRGSWPFSVQEIALFAGSQARAGLGHGVVIGRPPNGAVSSI